MNDKIFNKSIDIVMTKRTDDFHACIRNHPELWGCGRTHSEAIGNLISAHKEHFGIKIHIMLIEMS